MTKKSIIKITPEWLAEKKACQEAVKWVKAQNETDAVILLRAALKANRFQWANEGIVNLMDRRDSLQYAVFAAEQVIGIYEKKCPDDKRPRLAIEAARKCLLKDTKANRTAANACADDAYAAAAVAYAIGTTFARAVYAAAYTANGAGYGHGNSAAVAATAVAASVSAKKELASRILEYGISLLEANPDAEIRKNLKKSK